MRLQSEIWARWRSLLVRGAALAALAAAALLWQTGHVAAHAENVEVSLAEFSVGAAAATITIAGPSEVETFTITNTGEFPHEFVVIRTDLAIDELPLVADASEVDEGQLDVVAKTELIMPGETATLTATLTPGLYALICNVTFDGFSHYTAGMYTTLTVVQGVDGLPATGSGGLAAGEGGHAATFALAVAGAVLALAATLRVWVRRRTR